MRICKFLGTPIILAMLASTLCLSELHADIISDVNNWTKVSTKEFQDKYSDCELGHGCGMDEATLDRVFQDNARHFYFYEKEGIKVSIAFARAKNGQLWIQQGTMGGTLGEDMSTAISIAAEAIKAYIGNETVKIGFGSIFRKRNARWWPTMLEEGLHKEGLKITKDKSFRWTIEREET